MARSSRDPWSGAREHARREESAIGDVADGANNCEQRQVVLQSTPMILTPYTHVLESWWSLVIPFLAAEGTDSAYCDEYNHFHNVCCRCRRTDTMRNAHWRSKRDVFYGCDDCNAFRILNVVSKSMQELCEGPVRCGYCQDFEPMIQHITCERCLELREDVRVGRVNW